MFIQIGWFQRLLLSNPWESRPRFDIALGTKKNEAHAWRLSCFHKCLTNTSASLCSLNSIFWTFLRESKSKIIEAAGLPFWKNWWKKLVASLTPQVVSIQQHSGGHEMWEMSVTGEAIIYVIVESSFVQSYIHIHWNYFPTQDCSQPPR